MARKPTNTLKAATRAAAGKKPDPQPAPAAPTPKARSIGTAEGRQGTGGVAVAAIYTPQVRKVLKYIEADTGMTLRQLLGEGINHLAVKYGYPEPYSDEQEQGATR